MTLLEKYSNGAINLGFVEVKARTSKYKVFERNGTYLFLGKSGAVRISKTSNSTDSLACSSAVKEKLKSHCTK